MTIAPPPSIESTERRDRSGVNALFGDNRLKLGLFGINCNRAVAMTLSPDVPVLTWEYTKRVAQLADRAGFEALIPVARWKAVGDNGFNGRSFDTYAWAAGLAEATEQITLVMTSHVQANHPATTAKAVATIDHISGGRACLNIVNGWFEPEFRLFGTEFLPHDQRYAYTTEWYELVRKFWTEHDEFEFNGKFFTVSGGYSLPKPLQTPLPAVMNAGGSPAGRQFIANYADAGYVLLPYDLDAARVAVDQRKTDAATAGRDVATWTTAYVIQRDTREEAQRYLQHIFVDHADTSAGETMVKYLGLNSQIMSPDELAAFSLHLRAGSGGFPLVGTAEDIAETLTNLSAIGIDGVALSFVDFIDGLNRFTTDVIPQLEATGLRTPHVRH